MNLCSINAKKNNGGRKLYLRPPRLIIKLSKIILSAIKHRNTAQIHKEPASYERD